MVDYSNIPRDSRRVPLETRVQFKFDRFSGFLSEFSSNVSPGGMFIRTRAPQAPGTVLEFEFRLGDGFELIRGRGEVVWMRQEDDGPTRPAGMGLRFLELSQGSRELIYRIVDHHIAQGGTPFDVTQRPPDPVPVAPAAAPRPLVPPQWPAAPPPPLATEPPLAPPPATNPGAMPAAPALSFDLPEPPPLAPVRDLAPPPPEQTPPLSQLSPLSPLDDAGFDPSPYAPRNDDWIRSREPLPDEPFPDIAPGAPGLDSTPEPRFGFGEAVGSFGPAEETPPSAEEPAPAAAAPMFASTLAGARRRPKPRPLPWLLLTALALLAVVGFLFREPLLQLAGLGGEDEEIAQGPPPVLRRPVRRPEPTPATAGPETSPAAAPAETPAAAVPAPTPAPQPPARPAETTPATPVTEVPAVRPAPTPAPPPVPSRPAPLPAVPEEGGPAATALSKIAFEKTAAGTDVVLSANGALRAGGYARSRLDGNPPRELFRISGIKRPYPQTRVVVGTPEVLQVRTGLHPGDELFVVLDLAGPKVTVTGVEEGGNGLRIHLQRQP